MSFSTALLPPDPSDVTNELRRRIQVLEDSMRMPGVGGYAAEINANATPAVSVALDFTDPAVGAPGPVVKLTVPKSGRVLVMITARSIINADAGAARAAQSPYREAARAGSGCFRCFSGRRKGGRHRLQIDLITL